MRRFTIGLTCLLCLAACGRAQSIKNSVVSVTAVGSPGRFSGFAVSTAAGAEVARVSFGSLANVTAARVAAGGQRLTFEGLSAVPTPKLGAGSRISVALVGEEPFPEVSFDLRLQAFDTTAWQAAFGKTAFHFLALSQPGAWIFHHRGWSIMTPALDPYSMKSDATGYGRQVASEWNTDWTYAPAVGGWPLATMGLWSPGDKLYAAFDFHGARVTDHSEKDLAGSYCWQQAGSGPLAGRAAKEFIAVVWPYARPYRIGLRYPQLPAQGVVASHFRLLWSLDMPSDADPTRFVHQFVWSHYQDRLPSVPRVVDLSWLPDTNRPGGFPTRPGIPTGLTSRIDAKNARWWEPGALVFGGEGWDGDPIMLAKEQGRTRELDALRAAVDAILPWAKHETILGEYIVAWQQCLEGEGKLDMFGHGVPTIHQVENWSLGLALLDLYRTDPGAEAKLLPYVDGLLRFTKVALTTRNDYHDVPAAQFCWSAAPQTSFCLRYWFTFRGAPDAEHRALAEEAYKLAHAMLYRNLTMWLSDNNPDDNLDSAFLFEPNAGISWLGAACANEAWCVAYAAAQVYVETGDPLLAQYVYGICERWNVMHRNEYYPDIRSYNGAFTERFGLYDGAEEAVGSRASYGGLWGQFELLAWPMGTSRVRVLAGEKGMLSFCRDGRHTSVSQYRYRGQGRCSFRLDAAGPGTGEPFDLMVTLPYFDLRKLEVSLVRDGSAAPLPEAAVERYPQRPDTLLIRGVKHGDSVALGGWDPAAPILACELPKPRADADDRAVRLPSGFVAVDLQASANRKPGTDWSDVKSMAGWQPGRTELFGVPFVLLDPLPQAGRIAVRDAAVPVGQAGSTLFALVGLPAAKAKLTLTLAGGKSVQADLREAFRVLRGWPPVFEWEVQWLQVPLGGKQVVSVRADGIDLFAATVATLPAARLARTFAITRQQQAQGRADAATVAKLKLLEPLFEKVAGHIAVLPGTASSTPRSGATAQLLHRAGLIKYLDFLSPRRLIDPGDFNAERFWLTLYLGGENYIQSVAGPKDADLALQRYLHRGGTLLVLPNQPYPFYYNEKDEAVANAAAFGLPIIHGWEKPPADHRYSFVRNPAQQILTSLPARLPWPEVGDPRFRGVAAPPGSRYTPLLTLEDETHTKVGDAAAWIELLSGDLAGGKVGYVWGTLVQHPEWQTAILTDILKQGLTAAAPGLAEGAAVRAGTPPVIDGKLDEPLWREAPVYALAQRFMPAGAPQQASDVRCAWDDQNFYVALHAADQDAWSTLTQRDGNLWEGEVLEAYLDPDGDGRDYTELEVNPRGAMIDLRIGDPAEVGKAASLVRYRAWNSAGWQAAVSVDGTLDDRADTDRGWTVEMKLPFADLGVPAPKLGQAWRVQFFRIERPKAGELECSAWSATDTFHNPSRFGRLSFAANPHEGGTARLLPLRSGGRPGGGPAGSG